MASLDQGCGRPVLAPKGFLLLDMVLSGVTRNDEDYLFDKL